MKNIFAVGALFSVCFFAGYTLLRFTTEEYSINRDPAAVRNNFDLSNLSGSRLQESVKQRLISGLEFRKSEGGAGLALGHFIFVDNSGEKKLGCNEFGRVFFSFEADGVSVSGEPPLMEVEGVCNFSPDMSKIDPIFLPIAKILKEHPGDGEFQFNESKTTVRFTNLPEEWPKTWVLRSVRLINSKGSEAVVVDREEVDRLLGQPTVLTW